MLFKGLVQIRQVTVLILRENCIGDECMKSLGELLASQNHFFKIDLGRNKLTDSGLQILSNETSADINVIHFDLSQNIGITNDSVVCLIDFAHKSNVYFNVSQTLITAKYIITPLFLRSLIRGNKQLKLSQK